MAEQTSLVSAVHVMTRALASTLDRAQALRRTLEVALEAVDAEGGSVLLHEPSSRNLRFCHVVGDKADKLVGFTIRDDEGIAGQVFQTAEPRIDNDVPFNPLHSHRVDDYLQFGTRNLMTVPIRYPGGKVVGVVQLVNKRSRGVYSSRSHGPGDCRQRFGDECAERRAG